MSDNSRRKLLKSIAAGSGAVIAGKNLPENWARPVVGSVMLPAHALTSTNYSGSTITQAAMLETDSLFAHAFGTLVPEANAITIQNKITWCILPVNATQADVIFLVHVDVVEPLYANLYSVRATVGVETELVKSNGCSNAITDASNWLNSLGLVKDAQAACAGFITLDGLNINDSFKFVSSCEGVTVNDTLQAGSTCPALIICTTEYAARLKQTRAV